MIQIDDTGWGSLVGGMLIGAIRTETGEFACDEIPVTFFQGEAFARKAYLEESRDVARRVLEQLRVGKGEPIEICTGYVLEGVRSMLDADGYTSWRTGKITGALQDKIEHDLLSRVRALGVQTDYATLTTKQGLYFYQCVKWLKGGNLSAVHPVPERELLCKTGWATYRAWAYNPYEKAKQIAHAMKNNRRAQTAMMLN